MRTGPICERNGRALNGGGDGHESMQRDEIICAGLQVKKGTRVVGARRMTRWWVGRTGDYSLFIIHYSLFIVHWALFIGHWELG
jgi:hypothetical protein